AVAVPAAYLIRRTLEEPPLFIENSEVQVNITPLRQAVQFHWPAIIRVAAAALIAGASYVFDAFAIAFATQGYKLDKPTMLLVPVVTSVLALAFTPLAGALADKIGRKPVFII